MLHVATTDGESIACHASLMYARCSELRALIGSSCTIDSNTDSTAVYALLRWIYAEDVDAELHDTAPVSLTRAAQFVALGRKWGLRDVGAAQSRIAGRRLQARGKGTLVEDILRGYDEGLFSGEFIFNSPDSSRTEGVDGGWSALLQLRSSYFQAMLCGGWAESSKSEPNCHSARTVDLHWPPQQLHKLLRFLHGGAFVESVADLEPAVMCSKFFGVPTLLAEIHDWIAENLRVENASELWRFLESEPTLQMIAQSGQGFETCSDADDACFEFHIRNFEALANLSDGPVSTEDNDGGGDVNVEDTPLHHLSPALMRRLLSTGLVNVCTPMLKGVVKRFARAKCRQASDYNSVGPDNSSAVVKCVLEQYSFDKLCADLMPPRVMFNREHREALLPTSAELSARSFV